jgi:D-glycero-alpha-D-manno-heptose-7-phosphate kinase
MLIARAPLRVSLGGGGTDIAAYYEQYGGMVVSTSINKYFYVIASLSEMNNLQIISSDYRSICNFDEMEDLFWDGDLALPKAVAHHFGVRRGINLFLSCEVSPGTGLGSSSSAAVAMIKALSTLCDRPLSRQELAELACMVEIDMLKMPIGKQDQYAAAYGGLNVMHFRADGVTVEPLAVPSGTLPRLEQQLMLFFTGVSRQSTTILREQSAASARGQVDAIAALHGMKELAGRVIDALTIGDTEAIGHLLHEAWQRKRRLTSGVTTPLIDTAYAAALACGATGGKITGAGGGGYLMVACPPRKQEAVTLALKEIGLTRMHFRFDTQGATVLMNTLGTSATPFRQPVRPLVTQEVYA